MAVLKSCPKHNMVAYLEKTDGNTEGGLEKVQEDWEAEEVKKLTEEEATKTALSNEYDFIQARLNVKDYLLNKLSREEG
ncbi:hypothetical protein Tco_1227958 [Tanacetum coccineum]